MLIPFDDYPVHQRPVPLAHAGDGHPDFYDRFWFNGFTTDFYFGVAMALYPNRGIIDAAVSVVHDEVQRSVFASGRLPADPTRTTVGPIRIEIVEPLRVNRVVVDAPERGIAADLTYRARTAALEEARQTRHAGSRLVMDVTRIAQWGTWTGELSAGGTPLDLARATTYGTKDRSWGVRPVGLPAPAAPATELPQLFFLWSPLHFERECLHFLAFEEASGRRWAETAAIVPAARVDGEPLVTGAPLAGVHGAPSPDHEAILRVDHLVRWAPGLRRSQGAVLTLHRRDRAPEEVRLEPLLTFRMRGLGYGHPEWGHGRWHDELAVGSEEHPTEALDTLDPSCLHVQQVMKATWGARPGIGVLEQLVVGPHAPSGFRELLDGAPGPGHDT